MSKSQERLRGGRKIRDMSDEELLDWYNACVKMEKWVKGASKARRSWKKGRLESMEEMNKRGIEIPE